MKKRLQASGGQNMGQVLPSLHAILQISMVKAKVRWEEHVLLQMHGSTDQGPLPATSSASGKDIFSPF